MLLTGCKLLSIIYWGYSSIWAPNPQPKIGFSLILFTKNFNWIALTLLDSSFSKSLIDSILPFIEPDELGKFCSGDTATIVFGIITETRINGIKAITIFLNVKLNFLNLHK